MINILYIFHSIQIHIHHPSYKIEVPDRTDSIAILTPSLTSSIRSNSGSSTRLKHVWANILGSIFCFLDTTNPICSIPSAGSLGLPVQCSMKRERSSGDSSDKAYQKRLTGFAWGSKPLIMTKFFSSLTTYQTVYMKCRSILQPTSSILQLKRSSNI